MPREIAPRMTAVCSCRLIGFRPPDPQKNGPRTGLCGPDQLLPEPGTSNTGNRYAFQGLSGNPTREMRAGDPYGIRTRVAAVKGRCPRPLDEGVADDEQTVSLDGPVNQAVAARLNEVSSVRPRVRTFASSLGVRGLAVEPRAPPKLALNAMYWLVYYPFALGASRGADRRIRTLSFTNAQGARRQKKSPEEIPIAGHGLSPGSMRAQVCEVCPIVAGRRCGPMAECTRPFTEFANADHRRH